MKGDNNPSIVFGFYGDRQAYFNLLTELDKQKLRYREIKFIDVAIPLDESYDEKINFFKSFIQRWYWIDRNPLLFNDMKAKFLRYVLNKQNFTPVRIDLCEWESNPRHKLLNTFLVPLFVQKHKCWATTDTEKRNAERIINFESDNYKPNKEVLVLDDNEFSKD